MTMPPEFIPSATWTALGWSMLHFLWAGAVVSALFFAVERLLLRNASPGGRYVHGLACLAALAATAGLCVWDGWPERSPGSAGRGGVVAVGPAPVVGPLEPLAPDAFVRGQDLGGTAADWSGPSRSTVEEKVAAAGGAVAVLPWLWLAGSGFLMGVFVFGVFSTLRLRWGSGPCSDVASDRCRVLRRRLGLRRGVGLRQSTGVTAPVLIGIVRPVIVLPAWLASGLSPAMLEWVLLHELAHVRRWDTLVIAAQRLLEAMLFFHPAVWVASRWVDREREFCCDAFALVNNGGEDAAGYAATLAQMAGVRGGALRLPAAAMANRAVVERIRRVLDGRGRPSPGVGAGLVGAGYGVLLVLFGWVALALSAPGGFGVALVG